MMNNSEIPVQLDLEGGFAVNKKPQSANVAVKEEFKEHHNYENVDSKISIKQEFDDYGANEFAGENIKQVVKEELHQIAIKEDIDGDAYCMDFLPHQDESLACRPIKKEKKLAELSTNQSTKTKRTTTLRQPKTILGPPPSLLRQAIQVISSNIENYHPCSFSIFSECQWESIIECRCETANKFESSSLHNRNKLLMPPISQKILSLIEAHPGNVHLTKSTKVDELLWSKIVEYSYPRGGMMRPPVLFEPYEILVNRLTEWGEKLVGLFQCKKQQVNSNIDPNDGYRRNLYDDRTKSKMSTESGPDSEIQGGQESLRDQSFHLTKELEYMLQTIQCSPMDVKLLSDSGVGKSVSKVVKIATKLLKQTTQLSEDRLYEALNGYPQFWIQGYALCQIGNSKHYTELKSQLTPQRVHCEEKSKTVSLLQILQQLLHEWKSMASNNGVAMNSFTANTSPRKNFETESNSQKPTESAQDETQIPFASFGKLHNMDIDQYATDLKLLHSSRTWKALYNSLQKRERMIREAHGEKVRASRKSLEKNRPKIGKVTLKNAVGRVRRLSDETPSCSKNSSAVGQARREAILNKSLGMRSKEARVLSATSSTSSGSSNKLSKLRQESKVASKWSKGTQKTVSKISHTSNTNFSSFGASVARAGGNNNAPAGARKSKLAGKQARVDLQGGKRMTLPTNASSKSIGMFSSLQSKNSGKRKR